MKKKILILCTGNSCRSQMAEGYLRHFAGDNVNIYSAGVETHVNTAPTYQQQLIDFTKTFPTLLK